VLLEQLVVVLVEFVALLEQLVVVLVELAELLAELHKLETKKGLLLQGLRPD
jgi:hypothetical protein